MAIQKTPLYSYTTKSILLLLLCLALQVTSVHPVPLLPKSGNQNKNIPESEEGVNYQGGIPVEDARFSSCGNLTSCSLVFNDTDVKNFQRIIFTEKALAVFMFVTIRNDTVPGSVGDQKNNYRNQVSGEIAPLSDQLREKWAWLRDRRGKFLATLPYDFDILSLTTLTRDVFDLVLNVSSSPSGCYANLSASCLQNSAAKAILAMTENRLGNVCLKVEKLKSTLKDSGYVCCDIKDGDVICDTPIKGNRWIEFALGLLWVVSLVFGLFAPLLFKYFPKEFRRSVHGRKGLSRGLPRSNSSSSYEGFEAAFRHEQQLLIAKDNGILDILRTRTESSFCSRFFRCLFVIAFSLLPVLQALLYWYLKKSEVGITEQLLGVGDAFITLLEPTGKYVVLTLYCFCILLVSIAVAIPKTLSDLARRLSGRKDERSVLGFRKPDELVCNSDKHGFQLMYENMVFHINCLMKFAFWKYILSVTLYPLKLLCHCADDDSDHSLMDEQHERDQQIVEAKKDKLWHKIFRAVFFLLLFPFWFIITLSAFIVYLIPVTYIAFRIWKMLFKLEVECECCKSIPTAVKLLSLPLLYILFIIFCICVEVSYFMLVLTISFNIVFLGSVIGFTVMGIIFYIDVFISYVVITLCCIFYIARSAHGYLVQFKRLKNVLFQECEKHDADIKIEASIRETFRGPAGDQKRKSSAASLQKSVKSVFLLIHCDDYDIPSIPLDLFLSAYSLLLPFKRVIFAKILKVASIFLYLMVVFSFVMSLVEFDAALPVVQALALLLLGAVPLLFQKSPHQVTEAEEKWLKFHIQELINYYCKRYS